jgi:hypothetical protein
MDSINKNCLKMFQTALQSSSSKKGDKDTYLSLGPPMASAKGTTKSLSKAFSGATYLESFLRSFLGSFLGSYLRTIRQLLKTLIMVFQYVFEPNLLYFKTFFVGLWSQSADKLTINSIPSSWIL